MKNSLAILTMGMIFGMGHYLSITILKEGFDDILQKY